MDEKELKQKMNEIEEGTNKVLHDIKEKVDRIKADVESVKELDMAKQTSEFKSFKEKATAELERLDELEKQVKAMPVKTPEEKAEDHRIEESKVLNHWFRHGNLAVPGVEDMKRLGFSMPKESEIKIQSVLDDPDSGYLKRPATFLDEIIKHITEYSPVRQEARVFTTDLEVHVPRRTAVATVSARSEAGTFSEETTRKYGEEVLSTHEMVVRFDAYYWMLEDSRFNLEAEARNDAAEAFANKEGTWFISGSGTGEAYGVMTAVSDGVISHRAQGEASTYTDGDATIKLAYDLNDQYTRERCVYMMRRATLGAVRTFTDGQGQYLMGHPAQAGPRTIEGFPVITAPDMPAVGAGNFPVIFGNFKRGYWVLDRMNLWVLKDPFTNSDSGYVTFKFRRRVGGTVVQPNAFYALEIAAS